MAFDPSRTTAENLADLKAQNEAADAKYAKLSGIPADTDADVMGYYDLSTEDWDATPEKVRDILRTLFAFE
jgi:hypothetical protein